jgi:hypothetical protein
MAEAERLANQGREVITSVNTSAADIAAVQELWREYWRSLGLSLDFQNFGEELRMLPGKYVPPAACFSRALMENRPQRLRSARCARTHARQSGSMYAPPTGAGAWPAHYLQLWLRKRAARAIATCTAILSQAWPRPSISIAIWASQKWAPTRTTRLRTRSICI